jgi:hypothetical protein
VRKRPLWSDDRRHVSMFRIRAMIVRLEMAVMSNRNIERLRTSVS